MVERERRERLCAALNSLESRAEDVERRLEESDRLKTKAEMEVAQFKGDTEALARLSNKALESLHTQLLHAIQSVANARRGRDECVVCLDSTALVVLLPCRHMVICGECCDRLHPRICPMCKKTVSDVVVPANKNE